MKLGNINNYYICRSDSSREALRRPICPFKKSRLETKNKKKLTHYVSGLYMGAILKCSWKSHIGVSNRNINFLTFFFPPLAPSDLWHPQIRFTDLILQMFIFSFCSLATFSFQKQIFFLMTFLGKSSANWKRRSNLLFSRQFFPCRTPGEVVKNVFLWIKVLIKILKILLIVKVAAGGQVQGSLLSSVEVSATVFC